MSPASPASISDALRTLDCWLWRIDPDSGRVETLGGSSPIGEGTVRWRTALRMCTADSRRAILDAARTLLAAGTMDLSQRVDGIEVPAASGPRPRIDLLIGRDPPGQRGPRSRPWIGLASSQPRAAPMRPGQAGTSTPQPPMVSANRPGPAPGGGNPGEVALDRDSLVREIHHRIKNHLQGMTGLVERYRNEYPGLGGALDAIGGQLHSIGTVYGLLARSGRTDLSVQEMAQAVTDGLSGIAPGGIAMRFPDIGPDWRIAEQYCVAIALLVNELVMNGIKHGRPRSGGPLVMVECGVAGDGCRLSIRNAGVLPAGFDFDSGACAKTGLQLVRSMLPSRGTALTIGPLGSEVEASLWLQPPVLLVPAARGMHNPDFAGGR